MRVTNDEAKPSLEDALEHYGVKGMKWGVRKDKSGSSKKGPKRPKPTDSQIRDARIRDASRIRKIQSQADAVNLAKAGKAQAKAAKELDKMLVDRLKHPDTATSKRMTSGEKLAHVALAVVIPGPGTVGAMASAGLSVAQRKSAERARKRVTDG